MRKLFDVMAQPENTCMYTYHRSPCHRSNEASGDTSFDIDKPWAAPRDSPVVPWDSFRTMEDHIPRRVVSSNGSTLVSYFPGAITGGGQVRLHYVHDSHRT